MEKRVLFKQIFGHSEFRPGQEELIDALLAGRDALGVMPTGAGKSICYQLPALLLPGLTLVISPLISLMEDQVAALAQAGICAAYINSSLSAAQYREVFNRAQNGEYKIIYVAPERLFTADFIRLATKTEVSFLAVDEAHCVSQWGQDFRPSYLKIADFVSALPNRPVVGAFTATATAVVKSDIEKLLLLQNPLAVTTGFDRPNLHFAVVRPKSKETYLDAFLAERPLESGIVYCSTRKAVESVCESLRDSGIAATRYHAGLSDTERKSNQEDFIYDRARVMVATNAFGMGIDKSNVGFVVHYNMPKNLESYYQEAGRAGRDGSKAHCVLLFSAGDVQTAKFLINNSAQSESLTTQELEQIRALDLQRLDQMVGYCKTAGCLRAYILNYFGDASQSNCGNCGNCVGVMEHQDITVEAQKILSAVARVEKKYVWSLGALLISRMLHGVRDKRICELGLDTLPTHGIMSDIDRSQIRAYIDWLVRENYLVLDGSDYPVVRLGARAKGVLYGGERVIYVQRKQSNSEKFKSRKKAKSGGLQQEDSELLSALKALRNEYARKQKVPVYIVFSNATLADMADKQPRSMADFLQVSGVGEKKAERYGKSFLAKIASCQNANQ